LAAPNLPIEIGGPDFVPDIVLEPATDIIPAAP
jgi:hypothetical protein